MAQPRHRPEFLLEALARQVGSALEQLEGNLRVGRGVPDEQDLAHAAFAQSRQDLVTHGESGHRGIVRHLKSSIPR
jgi:hypothetical protein